MPLVADIVLVLHFCIVIFVASGFFLYQLDKMSWETLRYYFHQPLKLRNIPMSHSARRKVLNAGFGR